MFPNIRCRGVDPSDTVMHFQTTLLIRCSAFGLPTESLNVLIRLFTYEWAPLICLCGWISRCNRFNVEFNSYPHFFSYSQWFQIEINDLFSILSWIFLTFKFHTYQCIQICYLTHRPDRLFPAAYSSEYCSRREKNTAGNESSHVVPRISLLIDVT